MFEGTETREGSRPTQRHPEPADTLLMLDTVSRVRKATSRSWERNYDWVKKQVLRIECIAWQIAFK